MDESTEKPAPQLMGVSGLDASVPIDYTKKEEAPVEEPSFPVERPVKVKAKATKEPEKAPEPAPVGSPKAGRTGRCEHCGIKYLLGYEGYHAAKCKKKPA